MSWRGIVACVAVLAGIGAIVAVATREGSGSDWPRFLGPTLDGVSTETGLAGNWPTSGPPVLFRLNVGRGFSGVSVAEGRACTLGNTNDVDVVTCFRADTGAVLWRHGYGCRAGEYVGPSTNPPYAGPAATPAMDGDAVFTLSRRGHLHCLDVRSGAVRWRHDTQAAFGARVPNHGCTGSPIVAGDLLLVRLQTTNSCLLAFDKRTGSLRWRADRPGKSYSTAIPCTLGGQRQAVVFTGGALMGFDLATGRMRWRHGWAVAHDNAAVTPIVSGDRVFVSSRYAEGGRLVRVGGDTATLVWHGDSIRNHFGNCMLAGGYLYGFDDDYRRGPSFRCVDWETGALKWKTDRIAFGSLILADGKLVVLTADGDLALADPSPAGYREMARAKVIEKSCWTPPSLAHGRLYVRNSEGDVACLDMTVRSGGR
jgi:outer membrane protein assembly factor BamB